MPTTAQARAVTGPNPERRIPALEFPWAEIDGRAAEFKHCLKEHGAAVLRGAIDAEKVDFYRNLVERAYDACRQRCAEEGYEIDEAEEAWQEETGWKYVAINLHHGQLMPAWLSDCFPGFSIFDLVANHDLFFLLLSIFGARFHPSRAAHLRWVHPERAPADRHRLKGFGRCLDWHADAQAHGALRFALNLWTPLEDCGVDRPGLQMVLLGDAEARALSGYDAASGTCDPKARERMSREADIFGGAPAFAPEMRQGDILVFTHWTIHSTYVTPEMRQSRLSAELRFDCDGHDFPD